MRQELELQLLPPSQLLVCTTAVQGSTHAADPKLAQAEAQHCPGLPAPNRVQASDQRLHWTLAMAF